MCVFYYEKRLLQLKAIVTRVEGVVDGANAESRANEPVREREGNEVT